MKKLEENWDRDNGETGTGTTEKLELQRRHGRRRKLEHGLGLKWREKLEQERGLKLDRRQERRP